MKKVRSLVNILEKIAENFSMGALVSIVIVVFANVLSRATISHSFQWSEELPLILLNWFTVLGMSIAVGKKNHVAIEYFYSKMNLKNKLMISLNVHIVSAIFGGILLYFGIFNVMENLDVIMPATGFSQSVKYAMFPISGILMILYSFVDIVDLSRNKTVIRTMLEEDIKEAEEVMVSADDSKMHTEKGE